MNPSNFTAAQWLSVAMFITVSAATAGFWQDLVDVKTASAVSGGLIWIGSILQFILTGKMPVVEKAAEPTAPVA